MDSNTKLSKWDQEVLESEKRTSSQYLRMEEEKAYTITFLDDGGTEYLQTFKDNEGKSKDVTKVDFQVSVVSDDCEAEKFVYSVTVGGPNSTWYKLCKVFQTGGGSKGTVVHMTASGKGRDRRYEVLEYTTLKFKPKTPGVGEVVGIENKKVE